MADHHPLAGPVYKGATLRTPKKMLTGGGSPSFCWQCGNQLQRAPGKGLGLFFFNLVTGPDGEQHRIHGDCTEQAVLDGCKLVTAADGVPEALPPGVSDEAEIGPAALAEDFAELREAARQFHNLTQGDAEVIIRPPSAAKRDAIVAAGERLRKAISAVPRGVKVPAPAGHILSPPDDALVRQEHAADIASAFADLPDQFRAHPGVKRLYRVAVSALGVNLPDGAKRG